MRSCTCKVEYSTVQYSTVQYSTVQYSTVQYSTVQYSTVQYCTVQYSTVQYSTVQYSTVQINPVRKAALCSVTCCDVSKNKETRDRCVLIPWSCTVLYFTVLYCTVQYCTVLYSIVLYCTVLYCTVQYCTALYCTGPHSQPRRADLIAQGTLWNSTQCNREKEIFPSKYVTGTIDFVLYCTVLYCTVRHWNYRLCTVLYCMSLEQSTLYCNVLYSTVLYVTGNIDFVLYCTVCHWNYRLCTVCLFVCFYLNLTFQLWLQRLYNVIQAKVPILFFIARLYILLTSHLSCPLSVRQRRQSIGSSSGQSVHVGISLLLDQCGGPLCAVIQLFGAHFETFQYCVLSNFFW